MPRIDIVQTDGCAPILRALESGGKVENWGPPTTKSAGLTSPFPACGDRVVAVVKKTEGEGVEVTDEMNLRAEFMIGAMEGLFLQPASAAGVASLFEGARKTKLSRDETIVCIGTGTGKNAPEVTGEALGQTVRIPARVDAFLEAREKWLDSKK
jgi:threonine synthase